MRAAVVEESGSVGANNRSQGKTRPRAGQLEWWDSDDKVWRLAAPHDAYRHDFIVYDNSQGSYDITPEHGRDANDVTTFASALGQQHWNLPDRNSWGNIVDHEGNKVLYLIEKPERDQDPPEPGRFMMHNGLIMLDPDDHPVRDFPDVPRAFSSKIEGGRIEAFRRIYGMTLLDCRARMPRNIMTASGRKPLFGLTSLNQRTSRFRDQFDSPPWRANVLKRQTKKRLRQKGLLNDKMSTEGLTPLSKIEIEKRKLAGRGQHLAKANGRKISQEEREKRDRKHAKELRKLEDRERRRRIHSNATTSYLPAQDLMNSYPTPASTPGSKRKREYSETPGINDEFPFASQKRARLDSDIMVDRSMQSSPNLMRNYGPIQAQDHQAPYPALSQETRLDRQQSSTQNHASNMPDLRSLEPSNLAEQLSIQIALYPTRFDFRFQNGIEAPATPNDLSYQAQYWQLQSLHLDNWRGPGPVRDLVGIGSWYGSFRQVPIPEASDDVYSRLLQTSGSIERSVTTDSTSSGGSVFDDNDKEHVQMFNASGQDVEFNDFDGECWTQMFEYEGPAAVSNSKKDSEQEARNQEEDQARPL
ncbi:hypothetical protein P7C71_g2400, partial [Lecanoromycetidae sp. Uapishka_2]